MHNRHLRPPLQRFLATDADTLALGREMAGHLKSGMVVYLVGELGAGKTTLARGVLRGLGFQGRVKSPTFTLVEVYPFSSLYLYHFDFYRFANPGEWLESGFGEYFNAASICLVEWPENAVGLPAPDLTVRLEVEGTGRKVSVEARTEAGTSCLAALEH